MFDEQRTFVTILSNLEQRKTSTFFKSTPEESHFMQIYAPTEFNDINHHFCSSIKMQQPIAACKNHYPETGDVITHMDAPPL